MARDCWESTRSLPPDEVIGLFRNLHALYLFIINVVLQAQGGPGRLHAQKRFAAVGHPAGRQRLILDYWAFGWHGDGINLKQSSSTGARRWLFRLQAIVDCSPDSAQRRRFRNIFCSENFR